MTGASSTLEIDSLGTVTAIAGASPGAAALTISSYATLSLGGGTLATHGLFLVGDTKLASNTGGGTVTVTSGSLSSTATASAPAVEIGSAGEGSTIVLANDAWSVSGDVDVGTAGTGRLLLQGAGSIGIAGTLAIGSAAGIGVVTTTSSAAVDITGAAAIPTRFNGIAAASLSITGTGSSLTTGTLTIGAAGAAANATISRGSVSVGTNATIDGVLTLRVAGSLSAAGTITLDQGSRISGQGILQSAAIVDNGRIQVNSGTMRCLGPVSGDGLLEVSRAQLELRYGSSAGVALAFDGFGTVTVAKVTAIAGTIHDWGIGDAIRFTQAAAVTETFADHTLSLFNARGTLLGTETFTGSLTTQNFSLAADGKGTLLTYHP